MALGIKGTPVQLDAFHSHTPQVDGMAAVGEGSHDSCTLLRRPYGAILFPLDLGAAARRTFGLHGLDGAATPTRLGLGVLDHEMVGLHLLDLERA